MAETVLSPRSAARRRWGLPLIVALVVMAHALVTESVSQHLSSMRQDEAASIKRMEATFEADMQLTEPPVMVIPPAVNPPPPEVADVATEAASQPEPAASAPEDDEAPEPEPAKVLGSEAVPPMTPAEIAALMPPPEAPASAVAQDEAASSPPAPASAASSPTAPAFEWPKATRVTYKVQGYLRGEIHGSAKVEWIREGSRYQVHVDAIVGPSFAPLGSQRWTSEGVITPEGLIPERFESVNKLLIKSSPPRVVTFGPNEVTLPDGQVFPKMPGVQDPASHYIQLAYQFILSPSALTVGSPIQVPMAWTRRQEMITYDVEAKEAIDTPLGKIDTFRLKPRKLVNQKEDILAEIWLAPGLQYLPIKMLFRQGPETFLEMQMDKAPQQVAADAAPAPKSLSPSSPGPGGNIPP